MRGAVKARLHWLVRSSWFRAFEAIGAWLHRVEVVAHDRPRRHAASDRLESGALEGRGYTGGRRARRQVPIQWIGLECGRSCMLCCLQSRSDQYGGDALPPIALTHVEARE